MSDSQKLLELYKKAYAREKTARKESEAILNAKSLELYHLNKQLEGINKALDLKVHERTLALKVAKELAEKQSSALEVSNDRFNLAVLASSAGIWEWSLDNGKHYFSERLCQMLGYEHKQLTQMVQDRSILHTDDRLVFKQDVHKHLSYKQPLNCECRLLQKQGTYKWFSIVGHAVWDQSGKATRIAGSLTDINERVENALLIKKMANHDVLTQLPNRMLFDVRLGEAFKRAASFKNKFAILIIDVNDFKLINDTFGHAAGDYLLKELSQRFTSVLPEQATIARMGGDEFAVIVLDLENIQQIRSIVEQLIQTGSSPVLFDGKKMAPRFSIGIALYPLHGKKRTELMISADFAMYEAKKVKAQGSHYELFKPAFKQEVHERRRIGKDILIAIEEGQFYLQYQPLVLLADKSCMSVEALLRWKHPVEGNITPDKFIPIAEGSGLILQLGEQVFKMACQQIRAWLDINIRMSIAINISSVQFASQNLPKMFVKYIKQYDIPASLLHIEITETALMNKLDQAARILNRIHAIGIGVSLDDFGTGYSSLSYLQQLPIDQLKIDRVFIDGLESNKEKQVITTTIIQMAHALGLEVVAEGIENAAQLAFLEQYGCDKVQGYYIYRPMGGEALVELIS